MNQKNDGSGRLSVIIPTYNCREYIERCIVSVLLADPYEVIIIDDGSSDGTDQLCERLSDCYENIVVIQNHVNRGVVASRCVGISRARGEYIAFVDSDDWIEPEFLDQAIRALNCEDSIDIVVGRTLQDNSKGITAYVSFIGEEKALGHKEAIQGLFDWTFYRWELWGKVYRNKLFYGWKPDESIKICEDLDSNWELFKRADKTLCLPIDYYHYFYNEKSASYNVNCIKSNSYKVFERISRDGKDELDECQLTKVKEHYRVCMINMIRELVFQNGDKRLITETQSKLTRLYDDMNIKEPNAIKMLCQNYGSAQKLIREIEEETVTLFHNVRVEGEPVYLYGTGAVSDFISRVLLKNSCPYFGYIVSNEQMKKSSFHGKAVLYVDQIERNSVILLSVNCFIQDQLYCELRNKGYQHIYRIDTRGVV